MADNDRDDDAIEVNPAELLKKVERQAKTNKLLFTIVLAVSAVVITVMATGLTVLFFKLSTLSAAAAETQEEPMEEQFLALEQQLMLLADFRKSELKKITTFTRQLEKIAADCDLDNAAPYRDFLSQREQEYQRFISALVSGTSSLAGMNKGSKQWLAGFKKEMEELKQKSLARQSQLSALDKTGGTK